MQRNVARLFLTQKLGREGCNHPVAESPGVYPLLFITSVKIGFKSKQTTRLRRIESFRAMDMSGDLQVRGTSSTCLLLIRHTNLRTLRVDKYPEALAVKTELATTKMRSNREGKDSALRRI